MKQQLDAGADVYTKDDYEYTPLHNAAVKGRNEVTELLIAKNTDVNAMNDDDESLLEATFPETDSLLRKLATYKASCEGSITAIRSSFHPLFKPHAIIFLGINFSIQLNLH